MPTFLYFLIGMIFSGLLGFFIIHQTRSKKEKSSSSLTSFIKDDRFFRMLVQQSNGIIALLDQELRFIFRSDYGERLTGWSNEELINLPEDHIHPEVLEGVKAVYADALLHPGKTIPIRSKLKHKDGQYIWLEGTVTNQLNNPLVGGIIVNLQDVTQRVEAEEKLTRINRLYLFISRMNEAIIKATDYERLFRDACRIAVEVGQFRMSWIGLLDKASGYILPVTHAGEENGYLAAMRITSIGDTAEGMGPGGSALREGRSFVCNDIESAPEMAPWREAAIGRNYYASIGLPIRCSDEVIGLFSLYADRKNFFDSEETSLLEDMAANISFALDLFEQDKRRKRAEEELFQSRQRYQVLTEISPVGIFRTDAAGLTTYVNKRWCEISGMPADKAMGNGWLEAVHPADRAGLMEGWLNAAANGEASAREYRMVRPDGALVWILGQALPEPGPDGKIQGYVGTATDITHRIMAAREIEKIYKEKETALNRISDGVVSVDSDWRYTFLNDAALATHPLGRDGTLGKSIWEVHPEMRGTVFWDKYHEAMSTGRTVELEDYFPPMNTWFSVKVYPSEDGLTIFYGDITKKKMAELQLSISEEKYRKAQAIGRMGHWQLDISTRALEWSDEIYRIFDIGREEFGNSYEAFLQTIHPEDLEAFERAEEAALLGVSKLDIVHRIFTKSGEIKYIHELGELQYNEAGQAVTFTGTVHDITEQMLSKNEIINERNLSDSIINSLPNVFYLYTKEGRFIRWNQNFERVTLYGPDEIRNMHPLDFFEGDDKRVLAAKIENVFQDGQDSVLASFYLKSGKKIPYFFTGNSIIYQGRPCLLGVGIDFTERLEAQEKIRETTEQLRELAAHLQNIREEERADVARDIHDDLGQQLTAVQIAMYRLARQFEGNEPIGKQIQSVVDMVGNGINSIRRISTRLRPGILDDLGLAEAIKWQIEEFKTRFSIPVSAEFFEGGVQPDAAISINLFRIFQETLTNIARHANATSIQVAFKSDPQNIFLRVKDNGKGIDFDQIRAKRTLGLLGMKERAHAIGGQYEIISSPGHGTTVEITVSLSTPKTAS